MNDTPTSPVETLLAALKPFAEDAKRWDDSVSEMFPIAYSEPKLSGLRVGDLRRAAAAYATLSQPGMNDGWKAGMLEAAKIADDYAKEVDASRLTHPVESHERSIDMAKWVAAYGIGDRIRKLSTVPVQS